MFLVSFLYERRCLRIDLLKINCCLNVLFNIWFLYVLNRLGRNLFAETTEIYAIVMGSCLCLFLRCSFRIIFILIRYVATIAMKAFYDEALRIAFKHCYDFQLVSIDSAVGRMFIALADRMAWHILF